MKNQSSSDESTARNTSRRRLKICCATTAIVVILTSIISVILYFTVFKPKQPAITTKSATLQNFRAEVWPALFLNFTLGLGISIDNKNYGGFKYKNSTAYVRYEDIVVGEIPIYSGTVKARKKHDIDMSITIFADKLLFGNTNFSRDFMSGLVKFTSDSTMHGKVLLFNNLIKKKATSYASCDISLHILPTKVDSFCKSRVRF